MTRGTDFRVILAAVADPAGRGQVAAPKAVELAHEFGAEVVLYHACYEPALTHGGPFVEGGLARARREYVAERRARLESLAARLATPAVAVGCVVEWHKDIAAAVIRGAMAVHADLVVAEPRYHASRRARFRLSHTDWELARNCPMPLLLARTSAPYSRPGIVAAVAPGEHGERESQLDVKLAELAARLGEVTGGSVKIVHSLQTGFHLLGVSPRSLERTRARMRELLGRLARGAGLRAGSARVIEGEPATALLEFVTGEGTDLLVMGTFVQGPLHRALFGSVAERLINVAPCDVLIVKPDGFRSAVPPPRRRQRKSA